MSGQAEREVGVKEKRSSSHHDHRARKNRYLARVVTNKDKGIGVKSRGVLVTCGTRQEAKCKKEALLLFGEVAEKLYPSLFAEEDNKHENGDKAKGLEDELKSIRESSGKNRPLFSSSESGVNGAVFVRFEEESLEPVAMVTSILTEAKETGMAHCRYCVRFMPVQDSCYAKPADAADMCEKLAARLLPAVPEDTPDAEKPSYAIVFRKANNANVHREEFIKLVADKMPKGYKVNLGSPDWVLGLEVMRTTCCASLMRNFYGLGKFNVQTVLEKRRQAEKQAKEDTAKETKDGKEAAEAGDGAGAESVAAEPAAAAAKDGEGEASTGDGGDQGAEVDDTVGHGATETAEKQDAAIESKTTGDQD